MGTKSQSPTRKHATIWRRVLVKETVMTLLMTINPNNRTLFNRHARRSALSQIVRHGKQVKAYGPRGRKIRLARGLMVTAS